ncbi:MAG: DUF362 domain-containing protein [Planctomycetota bacterium]|nr:DUF362 domain-containing protein [Planctomycetota bacterium]
MNEDMNVNRRRFLEQVAAWSAGVAATAPVFRIASAQAPAAGGSPSMLAVAKGKDYDELVGTVLEPLGGMKAFVSRGDRVVVKPNIGWDRTPELAANTHPEVVKGLVQQALDAGAKEVLVFDRTCNEARLTYKNSGIKEAVESIGDKRASCPFIDERKWMPVKIEKGKIVKEWRLYADAIRADCYINVPVAKHHAIGRLTLGLKNVMGVMGDNRGKIHRKLGQSLADLNLAVAPKLTVIDATRILLRHGPTGGNLEDVKVLDTLIASPDMVAADAYATTLFDMKPEDIPATVAGHEMGIGEIDLKKVKIVRV